MLRFFFILCSCSILCFACDKNQEISAEGESDVDVSFSYINPQGKSVPDSSIDLPTGGFLLELGRPVEHYLGASFKNTSTLTTAAGKVPAARDHYVFRWELHDSASDSILRRGDTFDYSLDIPHAGEYRLALYAYDTRRDPSMTQPIDSASKSLSISDKKLLKKVTIDTLLLTGPYYMDLQQDAAVNVFIRIYASQEDKLAGKDCLYQSPSLRGLKQGATNLQLPIDAAVLIPNFIRENDQCYIQLYFEQEGKVYGSIDNASLSVFKHYQTGFLSADKSYLVEERKLRFGGMRMELVSGFNFMIAD